jgi:hypothetical protein
MIITIVTVAALIAVTIYGLGQRSQLKIAMEENNKQIEPEIIDAIEHVPCCRICCENFIKNHDES